VKLHPSVGARIRVITDNYSHETHGKTRNIIYIIVLGLSRRSPAGVQVLWPLWARGQIQESLLSVLSFPNPQSAITVLSFPPFPPGRRCKPLWAGGRIPTSFLFLLSFPLSALSLEHFCLQPQTAEGPSFSKTCSAALIVASTCSSSCAVDRKSTSNWEGAMYIPCCRIP